VVTNRKKLITINKISIIRNLIKIEEHYKTRWPSRLCRLLCLRQCVTCIAERTLECGKKWKSHRIYL